jgi:hypothetical protein
MQTDRQVLSDKMEELRQKMVESATLLGLSHPTVLSYSQQLDVIYTISMQNQYANK